MQLKLSQRLLLLMLVGIIPLACAFAYILFSLKNSRQHEATDEAFNNGQLASLEIQRILTGFESVLITLSSAPAIRELHVENCTALLTAAANRLPGVSTLGVIDLEGVVRCRQDNKGLGTSLKDRGYFREALASDKMVVSTFLKSRITGKATLPLAMRVINGQGQPAAVVALSVDLDWLQQRVAERNFSPGSSITLADREGTIIAREPLPERFVGTRIPSQYQYLVNAPEPGTIEVASQDGTKRILAYFPASGTPSGLYLSTGVSTDEVYGPVRSATFVALVAVIIALLSSLLFAWQTSRKEITLPMRRIMSTLNDWHQGRGTERTGMKPVGEFGEVGSAIDQFMDELEEARRQQELLVGELNHRIKNILSTVQSVARQTFGNIETDRSRLQDFNARVNAMANAFNLLTASSWSSADLREIVWRATQPFDREDMSRFRVEGPEYPLDAKSALAFSMAIHELCTNAAKYGALSQPEGRIDIEWQRYGRTGLQFVWQELGGPPVKPPEKMGFGTKMIERVLASQAEASVSTSFHDSGFRCEVTRSGE